MAVETAADRAVFTNPDDFGVEATFTPVIGSPATINGIFDRTPFAVDIDANVPVQSTQMRFIASTTDLPAVAENDIVTIEGTDYVVRVVEPDNSFADGKGMTTIWLEEPD